MRALGPREAQARAAAGVRTVSSRRFPAPWSVRELEQALRIEDANGQAVAYTYFRRDENEARQANVLTWDEARRIAANIAKAARPADPEGGLIYAGSQNGLFTICWRVRNAVARKGHSATEAKPASRVRKLIR